MWTPRSTSWRTMPVVLTVAFDHDATDPKVLIYTATPEGILSPGRLLPLAAFALDVSQRIRRELRDLDASPPDRTSVYYDRRRVNKWARRLPLLTTLIRIRKATVQALCEWDLTDGSLMA